MQKEYDVTIIGAGIVGSMLAYKLSSYRLSVALIEKAADVCEGISKANSGVLHAGFNVPTGTLKARFNLAGLKQYPKILKKLKIPFKRCKKLVVAFDSQQKEKLKQLRDQGIANGCKGLKIIDQRQIKRLNPKLEGKWALYSPTTAIVSPYLLTTRLAEMAKQRGVSVLLESEITAIDTNLNLTINKKHKIKSKLVINAAGINADQVATLFGPHPHRIFPCRGEYYILDKKAQSQLDIAVYPVPLDDGRSLGVHLTPTLNGNILFGPSAEYQDSKEDLSNSKEVMTQLKEEAYKLFPALQEFSFIKSYAGLRPKLAAKGFSDFVIETASQNPAMIHLLGIESPGLTAAPAIADYLIEKFIRGKIHLKKRFHFQRERHHKKKCGDVVCRCEQISQAEIEQALDNNLKSQTLGAIKKRTHATMGRCQGAYCHSKIAQIMKQRMPANEIRKNKKESALFRGERS